MEKEYAGLPLSSREMIIRKEIGKGDCPIEAIQAAKVLLAAILVEKAQKSIDDVKYSEGHELLLRATILAPQSESIVRAYLDFAKTRRPDAEMEKRVLEDFFSHHPNTVSNDTIDLALDHRVDPWALYPYLFPGNRLHPSPSAKMARFFPKVVKSCVDSYSRVSNAP